MRLSQLPHDERPREKMFAHGAESLTVVELLAILLRTGLKGHDVLDFSASVLNECGGLEGLCRMTPAELKQIKGLKGAKAATLSAVIELGRRIARLNSSNKRDSWNERLEVIARNLEFYDREEIYALFLDSKDKVIDEETISYGGQSGAYLDVPVFYRKAVRLAASSVVLLHNHPNGVKRASSEDAALTEHLRDGLRTLGIKLKGHYIAAKGELVQV
jgi:DNA repair protein RadC